MADKKNQPVAPAVDDAAAKAADAVEAEKSNAAANAAAEEDQAKAAAAPTAPKPQKEPKHRFETFERTRPDGVVVVVKRNIDNGEQTVTEKK